MGYCGSVCCMEDRDLDELRWHWDSAYLISHPAPDLWLAQRRDTRDTLRADSPALLRDKIQADYLACPVSVRVSRPGVTGGLGGSRGPLDC
jgi:hypothetical protein